MQIVEFGHMGSSRKSPGGFNLFSVCFWKHKKLEKWLYTLVQIHFNRGDLQRVPWLFFGLTCRVSDLIHSLSF